MIAILLIVMGTLLIVALGFMTYKSDARSRKNLKPSPTAQGGAPRQARATGRAED